MQKPSNYDNISTSDYVPVAPGGHKAVIKQVMETASKTGNQMLVISFDFDAADTQPAYFMSQYLVDKAANRENLKWRGTQYLMVDDRTDYGPSNLKRFNEAVEKSNPGFQVVWGNGYADCFKGKKVGIVFRQEEYVKQDGNTAMASKPFKFCDFEKALEQNVPAPKMLEKGQNSAPYTEAANAGFMQVPDALADEGLPFM